jgi:hypothetical protein
MNSDERRLWSIGALECVMVSCCAGAELQVRSGDRIMVRELYPTKSDLYERARGLEVQYREESSEDVTL